MFYAGEFRNRASLFLVVLGLGVIAFGRLLVFQSDLPLRLELEEIFFAVSDTAPVVVVSVSEIVFQLQLWSASLTGLLLIAFSVPAVVSGDQIFMPGQTCMFIESFVGMRVIMTLSMVAIAMSDLFDRRGWHTAIVPLAAPLIAFGLSSARVILLILNPYSEIAAIHNLQGRGSEQPARVCKAFSPLSGVRSQMQSDRSCYDRGRVRKCGAG